eukprot:TRINITY_DN10146_c0_g1_i2.p1 TRINITY_DN10146_c0_g1~~TRINITY_DN10146_c0_g1_i2.p1  ORF type:complete len:5535 (-),score=1671.40 TRINITY_DN10146_c0_g1_i2:10-15267(-)
MEVCVTNASPETMTAIIPPLLSIVVQSMTKGSRAQRLARFFAALGQAVRLCCAELPVNIPLLQPVFEALAFGQDQLLSSPDLRTIVHALPTNDVYRSANTVCAQLWAHWCVQCTAFIGTMSVSQKERFLSTFAPCISMLIGQRAAMFIAVLVDELLAKLCLGMDVKRPLYLAPLLRQMRSLRRDCPTAPMPRYDDLAAEYHNLFTMCAGGRLGLRDMTVLRENTAQLRVIFDVFELPFADLDIADLLTRFESVSLALQHHHKVWNWAVTQGHVPHPFPLAQRLAEIVGRAHASLDELLAALESCEDEIKELGVEQEYPFLRYFVCNGSDLFKGLARKWQLARKAVTSVADFAFWLQQTDKQLRQLLSGKLDTEILRSMLDLMRDVDVAAEVQKLTDFSDYSDLCPGAQRERIIMGLQNAFGALQNLMNVRPVVETLMKHDVVIQDEDMAYLSELLAVQDQSRVDLVELPRTHARLMALFEGLTARDFLLLRLVGECGDVVQWMRRFAKPAERQRFEELKDQLTLQARDEFTSQLLNNVISAKDLLAPFMETQLRLRQVLQMVRLLDLAHQRTSSLNCIKHVNEHIDKVRQMFMQTEESTLHSSTAHMKALQERGRFTVHLRRATQRRSCSYLDCSRPKKPSTAVVAGSADDDEERQAAPEKGSAMDEVETDEFRRQLTYARTSGTDAERAAIDAFLARVQLFYELRQLLFKLEDAAHPEYQAKVALNLALQCDEASLEGDKDAFANALLQWQDQLREARNQCVLLQLLSNQEILNLIQLLQQSEDRSVFVELLLGRVEWPSAPLERIGMEIALSRTCISSFIHALRPYASARPHQQLNEAIGLAEQHQSLRGVQLLLETLLVPVVQPMTRAGKQYAWNVSMNDGARGRFGSILAPFLAQNRLPTAQELLECSSNTTASELRQLFARAQTFVDRSFVVIGINELGEHARSALFDEQLRLRDSGAPHADIYYLYIDAPHAASCSWMEQYAAPATLTKFDRIKPLVMRYMQQARPNVTVQCVSGLEGVGKTHKMRQILKQARADGSQVAWISINDQVDQQKVLQDLAALSSEKPAVIAFNVSTASNELDVNRLLFELFLVGTLRHSATGAVFALPRDSAPWRFVVEIPHRVDMPQSAALPLAQLVATVDTIGPSTYEFAISRKTRYVCKFLKAWQDRTIDAKAPDEPEGCVSLFSEPTSDAECRRLLRVAFDRMCAIEDATNRRRVLDRKSHMRSMVRYLYHRFSAFYECVMFKLSSPFDAAAAKQMTEMSFQRAMTARMSTREAAFQAESAATFVCKEENQLGSIMMEQFLREANVLCGEQLPNEKCERLLYPVHMLLDNSGVMSIMHRANPDIDIADARLRPLMRNALAGLCRMDEDDAQGVKRQESYLAWALSVSEGVRPVHDVLERCKFVLIPEFTSRLIMLHERKLAHLPVVIVSETGVGKTFLLQLYAELLNLDMTRNPVYTPKLVDRFTAFMTTQVSPLLPAEHRDECDMVLAHLYSEDVTVADVVDVWIRILQLMPSAEVLIGMLHELVQQWFVELPQLRVTDRIRRLIGVAKPTIEVSRRLLTHALQCELKPLFYRILLHRDTSLPELCDFLMPIITFALVVPRIELVVFFDEPNTSRQLGTIKELIMDRTLLGTRVPDNIFFVCAINPLRGPDVVRQQDEAAAAAGATAKQEVIHRDEYHVYPMPPAMEHLFVYFVPPTLSMLQQYVEHKITLFGRAERGLQLYDRTRRLFVHIIVTAQSQYVQRFGESSVSQRDIQRVFIFAEYLFHHRRQMFAAQLTEKEALEKSILMAVALVYYFRLPVTPLEVDQQQPQRRQAATDQSLRAVFDDIITHEIAPLAYTNFRFSGIVNELVDGFSTPEHFEIPPGIALNQALKENLMAAVLCIECKVPLGIIGKPGTSKTLSLHLAFNNMRGKQSPKEWCKQFHQVDVFWIQGSRYATSNDIKMHFERAVSREREYLAKHNNRNRCVVALDEASLTREDKHVLKVLHSYLDERYVAFICISNTPLDAANTNRMMTVRRSMAQSKDLLVLALGCLGLIGEQLSTTTQQLVRGLCTGYEMLMQDPHLRRMFHDRDFIYMLRHLHRTAVNDGVPVHITPVTLLRALEENFNGISQDQFQKLVATFFKGMESVIERFAPPAANEFRDVRAILRQTLQRRQVDPEHAQLQPRFKMLIDTSEDDSGARFLRAYDLLPQEASANTRVFHLSDFADDNTDLSNAEVISQIRWCMEQPTTVVLVNAKRIFTSFYDVFNQNFRVMTDSNGDKQLFSNVAIGPVTYGCRVHPQFQCIVHMPLRELAEAEAPLLSRFEKYLLSLDDVYSQQLSLFPKDDQAVIQQTYQRCQSFVETVKPERLYGYSLQNTLPSLFLSHMQIPASGGAPVFARYQDQATRDLIENSQPTQLQAMIRAVTSHLLQLCPPEALTVTLNNLRRNIAELYGQIYFAQQHFSIVQFTLLLLAEGNREDAHWLPRSHKHVIHVRTSGDVLSLQQRSAELFGGFVAEQVSVFQVGIMRSRQEFDDLLAGFIADEKAKVAYFVIKYQKRFVGHVNLVRQLIDDANATALKQTRFKTFVLVLHFAPDQLYNETGYASLFMNGWEFHFFDSLQEQRGLLTLQSLAQTVCKGETNVDQDTEQVTFNSVELSAVLRDFVSRLAPDVGTLPIDLPDDVCCFYNSQSSLVDRVGQLQATLQQFPAVLQLVLDRFHASTARSELYKQLLKLAEDALNGKHSIGYATLVARHFQQRMAQHFALSMHSVCTEFGLGSLYGEPRECIPLIVQLIEPPSVAQLESSADDVITLSNRNGSVSQMPLFHVLYHRIQRHVEAASVREQGVVRIAAAAQRAVESDVPLRTLLTAVRAQPWGVRFVSQYAREFARYRCRMSGGAELFSTAGAYLLLEQRSQTAVVIDPLVHIHLTSAREMENLEQLVSACTCIHELHGQMPEPLAEHRSRKEFTQFVWHQVFESLWTDLTRLCSVSDEEWPVAVTKWTSAFQFISQHFAPGELLQAVDDVPIHMELMAIAFLYLQSVQTDFEHGAEFIRHVQQTQLGQYSTYNLEAIVRQIVALIQDENKAAVIIVDLLIWFVKRSEWRNVSNNVNVKFLLQLMNGSVTLFASGQTILRKQLKLYLLRAIENAFARSEPANARRLLDERIAAELLQHAPLAADAMYIPEYATVENEREQKGCALLRQPLADVWFEHCVGETPQAAPLEELARCSDRCYHLLHLPRLQMTMRAAEQALAVSNAIQFAVSKHQLVVLSGVYFASQQLQQITRDSLQRQDVGQILDLCCQVSLNHSLNARFLFIDTVERIKGNDFVLALLRNDGFRSFAQWAEPMSEALSVKVPTASLISKPMLMLGELPGELVTAQQAALYDELSVCVDSAARSSNFAEFIQWVSDHCQTVEMRQQLKMMLLLKVYHDYFCANNLMPLHPLLAILLQQLPSLQLQVHECRVLMAFIHPEQSMIGYARPDNQLNELFRAECHHRDDLPMRHALVNLLALVIGHDVSPGRNFAWTHMFNPIALENTFGFASRHEAPITRNGVHYCCGCQLTADGTLYQKPDASRNWSLTQPALYLGYIIAYGGFCLNMLFDDNAVANLVGPILSQPVIDAQPNDATRYHGADLRSRTASYVFSRVVASYQYMMLYGDKLSADNCMLFVNRSLECYFAQCNTRVEFAMPSFRTLQELVNAERAFNVDIVVQTLRRFGSYRDHIIAAQEAKDVKTLLRGFQDAMPQRPTYSQYLSSLSASVGSSDRSPVRLLYDFTMLYDHLQTLQLVIPIALLYQWLHQNFSYSNDTLQDVTLRRCLSEYGQRVGSQSYESNRASVTVREGIAAFNQFHELRGGFFRDCRHDEMFCTISGDTALAYLVSNPTDFETGNILWRAITSIMLELDNFLRQCEVLAAALSDAVPYKSALLASLSKPAVSIVQLLQHRGGMLSADYPSDFKDVAVATLVADHVNARLKPKFALKALQRHVMLWYLLGHGRIDISRLETRFQVQLSSTGQTSNGLALPLEFQVPFGDAEAVAVGHVVQDLLQDDVYVALQCLETVASGVRRLLASGITTGKRIADRDLMSFCQSQDLTLIESVAAAARTAAIKMSQLHAMYNVLAAKLTNRDYLFINVPPLLRTSMSESTAKQVQDVFVQISQIYPPTELLALVNKTLDNLQSCGEDEQVRCRADQSITSIFQAYMIDDAIMDTLPQTVLVQHYMSLSIQLLQLREYATTQANALRVDRQWDELGDSTDGDSYGLVDIELPAAVQEEYIPIMVDTVEDEVLNAGASAMDNAGPADDADEHSDGIETASESSDSEDDEEFSAEERVIMLRWINAVRTIAYRWRRRAVARRQAALEVQIAAEQAALAALALQQRHGKFNEDIIAKAVCGTVPAQTNAPMAPERLPAKKLTKFFIEDTVSGRKETMVFPLERVMAQLEKKLELAPGQFTLVDSLGCEDVSDAQLRLIPVSNLVTATVLGGGPSVHLCSGTTVGSVYSKTHRQLGNAQFALCALNGLLRDEAEVITADVTLQLVREDLCCLKIADLNLTLTLAPGTPMLGAAQLVQTAMKATEPMYLLHVDSATVLSEQTAGEVAALHCELAVIQQKNVVQVELRVSDAAASVLCARHATVERVLRGRVDLSSLQQVQLCVGRNVISADDVIGELAARFGQVTISLACFVEVHFGSRETHVQLVSDSTAASVLCDVITELALLEAGAADAKYVLADAHGIVLRATAHVPAGTAQLFLHPESALRCVMVSNGDETHRKDVVASVTIGQLNAFFQQPQKALFMDKLCIPAEVTLKDLTDAPTIALQLLSVENLTRSVRISLADRSIQLSTCDDAGWDAVRMVASACFGCNAGDMELTLEDAAFDMECSVADLSEVVGDDMVIRLVPKQTLASSTFSVNSDAEGVLISAPLFNATGSAHVALGDDLPAAPREELAAVALPAEAVQSLQGVEISFECDLRAHADVVITPVAELVATACVNFNKQTLNCRVTSAASFGACHKVACNAFKLDPATVRLDFVLEDGESCPVESDALVAELAEEGKVTCVLSLLLKETGSVEEQGGKFSPESETQGAAWMSAPVIEEDYEHVKLQE